MVPISAVTFATNSVAYLLALVAVGLHLYSRFATKVGFGWHDGFVLMSMVFGTILLYIEGLLYTSGIGYPIAEVGSNRRLLIELIMIYYVMFVLTIITTKISMLCLYFRILTTYSKTRMAITIFIGIFLMWGLVSIVDTLTVCHLEKNNTREESRSPEAMMKGSSALSIVGDVVVFLLPLPAIWNLRTNRHTKIDIGIFLICGIMITSISILLCVVVASQDFQNPEFAILSQGSIAYAAIEATTGIACDLLLKEAKYIIASNKRQ
ncbi:hypothetical protein M434DRAFT_27172 [Hypoxylon sp. CO27-5]|nr:hypothetical protein M434DRAFT_27172 [Hypoxylon sp. CO27-5]